MKQETEVTTLLFSGHWDSWGLLAPFQMELSNIGEDFFFPLLFPICSVYTFEIIPTLEFKIMFTEREVLWYHSMA